MNILPHTHPIAYLPCFALFKSFTSFGFYKVQIVIEMKKGSTLLEV